MATLSAKTKSIRKSFIEHTARRYVIDESENYPRAISASGRTSNLSSLTFNFPAWAQLDEANRRIPEDEFIPFMKGLETAIRGGLPRVCGISFKPINTRSFVDSKGDTLLNTYLPYAPERPANYDEVKATLDDYAARLFHQNADDKKHLLQFCGDIIQNPSRRPQWGIIIRGFSGTGKSTLPNLLKVALGGRYVWSENDYAPVFKQFAEVLPNNLVVSFDDATASKSTPEDLKLAVTRDTANVETKSQQTIVERDVYSRVFVISNKPRPFILPSDDRRFYVTEYLDHQVDFAESESYYEKFTAFWKNPDNAAGIHWWFKDVDLTGFTAHACMKTEARSQLIAMSTSGADAIIAEFLGGKEMSFIDADGVTQTNTPPQRLFFLECQLADFFADRRMPAMPLDLMRKKLGDSGYEETRRVIRGCNDNKQIDMWQKTARRAPSLTADQIAELTAAFNSMKTTEIIPFTG